MRLFYSFFVLTVNLVAIKLMFKLYFEIYPRLTYLVHTSKEHWVLPLALFNLSFLLYISKESRITPVLIKKHINKHHLIVLIVSIVMAIGALPNLIRYGSCEYSSSFAVREAHNIFGAISSYYSDPDNIDCASLEDLKESEDYKFIRTDCHIVSGIKKVGAYIHCEDQVEKIYVTTYIVPNRWPEERYFTIELGEDVGIWSHEWPYSTPEPIQN